jgi:Mo25-like
VSASYKLLQTETGCALRAKTASKQKQREIFAYTQATAPAMSSLLKNLGVKKKKSPEQLVRAAAQALDENNTESIAKRLAAMKEILYGEEDKDPVEAKCKELSASLRQAALMPRLIEAMPSLPFETRKDLAQVFNNLVRKNHEGFAEYVAGTPSIVPMLVSATAYIPQISYVAEF